jgi:orotate phosphoribosyltransferase
MINDSVLNILKKKNAIQDGHFILRSGEHSRQYLQCSLVFEDLFITDILAWRLICQMKEKFNDPATVIVSPAMGGLLFGYAIARYTTSRFIFAEKENDKLVIKRSFKLQETDKVIIIDDVITKGGRVLETAELVKAQGAEVIAYGSLVDRTAKAFTDLPYFSLIKLDIPSYPEDKLPEDLKAIKVSII